MRRWWDRYRRGLVSRTRVVVVQDPGSVIVSSGLRSSRYSVRIVVIPGDVL